MMTIVLLATAVTHRIPTIPNIAREIIWLAELRPVIAGFTVFQ